MEEDPEKQFLDDNDMQRFVTLAVIMLLQLTYSEVGCSANLLYHSILLYLSILLIFQSLEGSRNKLLHLHLIRDQFFPHL